MLMYRISGGLNSPAEFFEPRSVGGQTDVAFHKEVCAYPKDVITKIIYHPQKPSRISEIFPLYDKVVWIIRDPRDQLISSFFYRWYHIHKPDSAAFHRALTLTRKKESSPTDVPFHTLAQGGAHQKVFARIYQPVLAELEKWKDAIFVVKYEDILNGSVEGLENWLGRSVDLTAEVKQPAVHVARSNTAGNWRKWFTNEDVTFYKPLLSPYLKAFGYCAEDWTLDVPGCLPPAVGSEYMLRIFSDDEA